MKPACTVFYMGKVHFSAKPNLEFKFKFFPTWASNKKQVMNRKFD